MIMSLFSLFSGNQIQVFADEAMKVGVAEQDITPPVGFPMAGYFHERLADGQIDPLKAKAIVFRGNDQQAALVICDLTGISVDLSHAIRTQASAEDWYSLR